MSEYEGMPQTVILSGFESMEPVHYKTLMKQLGHMGISVNPVYDSSHSTEREGELYYPPGIMMTESGLQRLPTLRSEPDDYVVENDDIDRAAEAIGKPHMSIRVFNLIDRNTRGAFSDGARFFSYQELKKLLEEYDQKPIAYAFTTLGNWPNAGKLAIEVIRLIVENKQAAIEQERRKQQSSI